MTSLKTKDIILYLLTKLGPIEESKLNYLLFKIDTESFINSGQSITDLVYEKGEDGPAPRNIKLILQELIFSGDIKCVE